MSPKSHSSPHKRNEDKIELIFKSKRENVYTAGVSLDNRINYHPKNIKKSLFQSKLIRTYTQHVHFMYTWFVCTLCIYCIGRCGYQSTQSSLSFLPYVLHCILLLNPVFTLSSFYLAICYTAQQIRHNFFKNFNSSSY